MVFLQRALLQLRINIAIERSEIALATAEDPGVLRYYDAVEALVLQERPELLGAVCDIQAEWTPASVRRAIILGVVGVIGVGVSVVNPLAGWMIFTAMGTVMAIDGLISTTMLIGELAAQQRARLTGIHASLLISDATISATTSCAHVCVGGVNNRRDLSCVWSSAPIPERYRRPGENSRCPCRAASGLPRLVLPCKPCGRP